MTRGHRSSRSTSPAIASWLRRAACVETVLRADVRGLRDHPARRRRVGRVSRLRAGSSATRGSAISATRRASARCATCSRRSRPAAAAYTMAFHEDDLLGRHYLADRGADPRDAVRRCGFVAARAARVHGRTGRRRSSRPRRMTRRRYDLCESPAAFLRAHPPRRRADVRVGRLPPRRDRRRRRRSRRVRRRWSIVRFCWRSCSAGPAALVRDPLVWYRHHDDSDAAPGDDAPSTSLRLLHALPRRAARGR